MKTDMKNLLLEIKGIRNEEAYRLFNAIAKEVQTTCDNIYRETGCTVCDIKFPIRNEYIIGKKDPYTTITMLPEIQLSELNI